MESRKASLFAAGCGALAVIGVLLPWYSVSFEFGRAGTDLGLPGASQSFNGTEGDFHGGLVLPLALVAGIAAALVAFDRAKGLPISVRGLGLVALGGFALATLVTLTDCFRDLPAVSRMGFSAGRGMGMWVTVLAAGAGAWLSFLALRPTGSPTAS